MKPSIAQRLSWQRNLMRHIKNTRESKHFASTARWAGHAHGMIHAAYLLGAISGDEYDRASSLAINAEYHRNIECGAAPYTHKAPAQEAAA